LIADPTQKAVEKVGRDFLKALGRLWSNEIAVSKSRVKSAEYSKQGQSLCHIPLMMFLNPIKTVLSLRTITLLPESSYIEVVRFGYVVLRWVLYFAVKSQSVGPLNQMAPNPSNRVQKKWVAKQLQQAASLKTLAGVQRFQKTLLEKLLSE
jgi:hypothetical protein